jgi:hypothetical protein
MSSRTNAKGPRCRKLPPSPICIPSSTRAASSSSETSLLIRREAPPGVRRGSRAPPCRRASGSRRSAASLVAALISNIHDLTSKVVAPSGRARSARPNVPAGRSRTTSAQRNDVFRRTSSCRMLGSWQRLPSPGRRARTRRTLQLLAERRRRAGAAQALHRAEPWLAETAARALLLGRPSRVSTRRSASPASGPAGRRRCGAPAARARARGECRRARPSGSPSRRRPPGATSRVPSGHRSRDRRGRAPVGAEPAACRLGDDRLRRARRVPRRSGWAATATCGSAGASPCTSVAHHRLAPLARWLQNADGTAKADGATIRSAGPATRPSESLGIPPMGSNPCEEGCSPGFRRVQADVRPCSTTRAARRRLLRRLSGAGADERLG